MVKNRQCLFSFFNSPCINKKIAIKNNTDILDEPTSGLDPATRNEFLEILQEFIQDGEKSVLFSTHITTDLERITDISIFNI